MNSSTPRSVGAGAPASDVSATPLTNFEQEATYACCVAPFAAVSDTAATSARTSGEVDDDATITVQIPGRGRLTLPTWFADEYVTAFRVPVERSGHLKVLGPGAIRVMVPNEKAEETTPVFVTQEAKVQGWREIALFGSQNSPKPPTILGTPSERRVLVRADAGVILDDCAAVPHAVVPRLVLQHVVSPFVVKLKCTVAQACLGVTTLNADEEFPLFKSQNVTDLTLPAIPLSPLPPKTRSFSVVPDISTIQFGAPPNKNVLQNSLCGLTALVLRQSVDVDQLGTVSIPTLRTLVLNSLQHHTGRNSAAAIKHVSSLTPNVTSLTFGESAGSWDDAAHVFAANDDPDPVWPCATSLDFTGSSTSTVVITGARPWVTLILRICDRASLNPSREVELLAEGVSVRTESKLTNSLVELSVHFSGRAVHTPQPLEVLKRVVCPHFIPTRLHTFTMPRLVVPLLPPDDATIEFFQQAQCLEDLCLYSVDMSAGINNNVAALTDDAATQAFNAVFPPSLRCVRACRNSKQWVRSGDQWHGGPSTVERDLVVRARLPENRTAMESQVILVAEEH